MAGVEPAQIDTLVFDVLGTLLDEDGAQLRAAEEVHGDAAAAAVERWQQEFHDRVGEVQAGRRAYASSEELHREALAAVPTHGATAEQLERLATFGRRLDPFPEVPGAMARLAQRHALVALTNAGTVQTFSMSAHAGLRWTAAISGQTVQAYKPADAMYGYAVEALALDPARCLFVAAHPWDLDAATRHGFRTGYVDRVGSSATALAEFGERFDAAVPDLAALADLLG